MWKSLSSIPKDSPEGLRLVVVEDSLAVVDGVEGDEGHAEGGVAGQEALGLHLNIKLV